jgi:hypothetical protein
MIARRRHWTGAAFAIASFAASSLCTTARSHAFVESPKYGLKRLMVQSSYPNQGVCEFIEEKRSEAQRLIDSNNSTIKTSIYRKGYSPNYSSYQSVIGYDIIRFIQTDSKKIIFYIRLDRRSLPRSEQSLKNLLSMLKIDHYNEADKDAIGCDLSTMQIYRKGDEVKYLLITTTID